MAHFAQINESNIVTQVIVVNNNELLDENGVEQESKGQEFCTNLLGGNWIQTSYNSTFRKNYAGIGFAYDSVRDAFIPPKPYTSWALNENTCQWEAPVVYPPDNKRYTWDEENTTWLEVV
jgi:hypothetical protein